MSSYSFTQPSQLLTVNTLIFALVVYVMEIAEHLDGRNVAPGVIHDTL